MKKDYYIASCVFTKQFPQLSFKIQNYVKERYQMEIVRCCTPKYKLAEFEMAMPESLRPQWAALADTPAEDVGTVYSLCHNCTNILEETRPGIEVVSLWELILADEKFALPDYKGMKVTVQDCWRAQERTSEQDAVRLLLEKMNIEYIELAKRRSETEFCGNSLYRPQPVRNPKLAPYHYVEKAQGKFVPHTEAEQAKLMQEYCQQFTTDKVVCYCQYCKEGLILGGKTGLHIAELLFD